MTNDVEVVPEGWTSCLMNDVARIVGGGTPKTGDAENFATQGYAWITPADMSNYHAMYISEGRRFLTEKGLKSSSATLIPKGSVLFSSRAPIGYVAIANQELTTNQGFRSFICENGISPEYVYFYLRFAKPIAEEMASGTTFLELSGTNAGRIPFVLPPIAEQHRIAQQVKTLLACVDSTREQLTRVPIILKRFRQSVLAAACSGRLTADWREAQTDLEPASILLERIRQERKRKLGAKYREPVAPDMTDLAELPEGWAVASVDALTWHITSGSRDWKQFYGSGTGTFIMAQNVRPRYLDLGFRQPVAPPVDNRDRARSQVEYGDLLVTIVGANTGDVCPVQQHLSEHYVCQSVALMRPVTSELTPYLNYWLNSPEHGRFYYEQCFYGAGRPHLSFDQLKETPVLLPSLTEQAEIVRRVEALFKLADIIEKRVEAATTRADSLTQAVLVKAFRGELVPTEAELARQEGRDYETAEALLERIQCGRATTQLPKRKPKSAQLELPRI